MTSEGGEGFSSNISMLTAIREGGSSFFLLAASVVKGTIKMRDCKTDGCVNGQARNFVRVREGRRRGNL